MAFLSTERLSELILLKGPIVPWGDIYWPESLQTGPHWEFTKKRLAKEKRLKEYEKKLKKEEEPNVSVFVSYSHQDKKWAHGLSLYLEMIEADIYVDLRDDSLPRDVGSETAISLKRRISERDKFIVLATDKTKNSVWVPWELGIADGVKGRDNVVIFPLSSVTTFQGQEYFDAYNRVEVSDKNLHIVIDPKHNTYQEFSHWLHGVKWSKYSMK